LVSRQWYGRVNWARLNSPAIKSINQYYLDQNISGGTPADNLFAVAKYEQAGASPAFKDVVLCFANLFEHNATTPGSGPTGHFLTSSTYDLRGGAGDPLWNLLGLANSSSRLYNVRNLASSNANALIWTTPRTGAQIYSAGFPVELGGGTVNPITGDGELAQFLKIVDVTPPPSSSPTAPYYQIGSSATFAWTSNAGAHDHISSWTISVGTTPGGNDVAASVSLPGNATSYSFAGTNGTTYYATLTPVSAAGVGAASGQSDSGTPNPASATTPVMLLAANGDQDNDGVINSAEDEAGTNPLDQTSKFAITQITRSGGQVSLTFPTVPGRYYRVESSTDLVDWDAEDEPNATNQLATGTSMTFIDLNPGTGKKFYQAAVSRSPIP
jgi:hypothetical protein